jgi:hypothetical protein
MNYYIFILFILFILILFVICKNTNANYIEGLTNNNSIILIGDSMLNNSNYVPIKYSIPNIIKNKMKTNNLLNFAEDGSTINDCYNQLEEISLDLDSSNTNIVISSGGNDILNNNPNNANNINNPNNEFINHLFENYLLFINSVKVKFPLSQIYVLNLYYPPHLYYKTYYPLITKWNKYLEKNSYSENYKVIQTNKIITQNEDLVNYIEPSEIGGEKIAAEIVNQISLYNYDYIW